MTATSQSEITDNFKHIFKKYKRKFPAPDLNDVIDFDSIETDGHLTNLVKEVTLQNPQYEAIVGLKPVSEWKAYQLVSNPGLIFIPNPFLPGYQKYWVKRCLQDFPCKPNRVNLDAHMELSTSQNVFNDSELVKSGQIPKDCLLMKLRWATIGYQYEWNTRVYDAEKFNPLPFDVDYLAKYIASTIGYNGFHAQAGITNFYHMDCTLMAHVDYAEFDHGAPLISTSFGQNCIFLIGGDTKETQPTPMFMKSGDILIMSQEARLSYHAVPRILTADVDDLRLRFKNHRKISNNSAAGNCDKSDSSVESANHCGELHRLNKDIDDCVENINWEPFEKYLEISRINLNVRQVLKPGDTIFPDEQPTHHSAKPCAKKQMEMANG